MGPRSDDRGNETNQRGPSRSLKASMGPRSDDRGNLLAPAVWVLQRRIPTRDMREQIMDLLAPAVWVLQRHCFNGAAIR
jgi:hypothetical protein